MKTTLIAAAALLALGTLPALAAEGNGDPFALRTPGIATTSGYATADTGSESYPDVTGRPGSEIAMYAGSLTPDTGNEAPVQTANSLPPGADTSGRLYAHLGTLGRTGAVQSASRTVLGN